MVDCQPCARARAAAHPSRLELPDPGNLNLTGMEINKLIECLLRIRLRARDRSRVQ
jgi:hypothetical protein